MSKFIKKSSYGKILITSPSLNSSENVGGISSLVENIIKESFFHIIHFELGSPDNQKKRVRWAAKQFLMVYRLVYKLLFERIVIVHINMSMEIFSVYRDSIVFIISKIFRKKIILHNHGGYYLSHHSNSRIFSFLIKLMFKNAHKIIILSEIEKEILINRYGELPIEVLANAVAPKFNLVRDERKSKNLKLFFLGRISEDKGIYTISESFQYLKSYFDKFTFYIYGTGPDLDNWILKLKEITGLNFFYNGIIAGDKKWEMLNGSDIFLLPSKFEGLPLAMLESMAMGCTVIVSDVGSIKTVVTNNLNGIILKENSAKSLAITIENILKCQIDIYKIGCNAQKNIMNNFSFSKYIKHLNSIYTDLIRVDYNQYLKN